MNRYLIGIKTIGWIEMLTILAAVRTIVGITQYPQMLLIWSLPVALIGLYTINLKAIARRLNLFLSPLIVIVYSCGFFMIFERIFPFALKENHFYWFSGLALVLHVLFFSRPAVKQLFDQQEEKQDDKKRSAT